MRLFGIDLFGYKKPSEPMYDFAQHGILNNPSANYGLDYIRISDTAWDNSSTGTIGSPSVLAVPKPDNKNKKSPKQLFEAKALNDHKFVIKTDPTYLNAQILEILEKISLMGKPRKHKKGTAIVYDNDLGGVKYGREELKSILMRLENRRKINVFKPTIDKYPHTTSSLIAKVIEDNDHLRCQKAAEFIPDMPKDAIAAMKEYTKMCVDLCNQTPIFYVIGDQDDFKVKNRKRDPILLAQSPFGFFWQILGAWDKEMIYLGDL